MSEETMQPQVTVRNIPQESYNSNIAAGASQPQSGGIKGHLQRNWPLYALGLGLATIVVMIWKSGSSNTASNIAGSTAGTMGLSSDQLYGSQLDADYQQLMSMQNQQLGLLNTISNTLTNPSTSPTVKPIGPAGPVLPVPKGTSGYSDNFWIYTTKPGDTAFSLNKMAGWQANGPGFFENYRNNMDVLHAAGYDTSNPYNPIPIGTKVSL